MRVVRLELFGFKSFMDKTVLPLDVGMTGVVGPNGCGKSNVVDALRWVLGETRASTLRGSVLEDVIFNGTDKLRPLGLAEVSLTIRSERQDMLDEVLETWRKGSLVTEDVSGDDSGAEISASSGNNLPPAEASLSSDQSDAVAEAVRDSVVAAAEGQTVDPQSGDVEGAVRLVSPPALVVLEGGKLNQQEGPGEEISDSTAPLAQNRASTQISSDEDPSSLESLQARFRWLRGLQEVQLTRRLYRSGESEYLINRVTSRLRDVRDLCRALGIGARAHTIVAQGEVARIVTSKPEERRTIIEEAAGVSGLRERVATTEKRLSETSQNLARLSDIVAEVERQVASLKRQASLARARVQIKSRLRELDLLIAGDVIAVRGGRAEDLQQEKTRLEEKQGSQGSLVEQLRASEEKAREELVSHEGRVDDLRRELDRLRDDLNSRLRLRSQASARISELRALVAARQGEIDGIAERRQTLVARGQDALKEVQALETEMNGLASARRELEQCADKDLGEAAERLDRARRELRLIEDKMKAAREILISEQSTLREVESQIQSLSPVARIRQTVGDQEGEIFAAEGEAPRLLADVIQVQPEYVKALQAVLAERAACVVTDDPHRLAARILSGADRANQNAPSFGAVKRLSSVLGASSSLSSAVFGEGAGSTLVPLRKFVTSEAVLSPLVDVLLAGIAVVETLEEAVTWFAHNPDSPATLVSRGGDIVTAVSFLSHRHEGGLIQLRAKSRSLLASVKEQEESIGQLERELTAQGTAVQQAKAHHDEVLRTIEERRFKIRELAQKQGVLSGRIESSKRSAAVVDQDIRGLALQQEAVERRLADYQREESQAVASLASLGEEGDAPLVARIEEGAAVLKELEAARGLVRERSASEAKALAEARDEFDRVRTKLAAVTLEADRIAVEMTALRERLTADYGAEIFAEIQPAPLADESRGPSVEEAARLRARIAREGEIDPTVIARFEEEERRLADLRSKRDDLVKAAETLKETAARLREAALRRFLSTFEAVRENFGRLISRLYGGGQGTLELSNPADPLESGVDINVRPPGKKPKSIDVLSGGEKALCATALLFSLFLERPSPLCVLDEVDAPLDEANLVRFVTLAKEMSSSTQFVVITHNKGSMQAADRLVGVTMQQPGASTLITVSLQEAFKAVA